MRTRIVRLMFAGMMLAGTLAFLTIPAQADSGGPFQPGDKRVSPETGDPVAIYCNDNSIDVWGINNLSGGFDLTTFSLGEATSTTPATHATPNGAVTLTLLSQPVTHYGFAVPQSTALSLIVDSGTQYRLSWAGVGDKTFSCTYLPLHGAASEQAAPAVGQ